MTDHVKQSYVRTKENIMQSTEKSSDRENNPVGYAEDVASEYADRIFHETGHQVRRQAGKIIERKKGKASVSSERDKRTIKTGRTSEQVVKNTGKGTIKIRITKEEGVT